jgi:hypothetical protein
MGHLLYHDHLVDGMPHGYGLMLACADAYSSEPRSPTARYAASLPCVETWRGLVFDGARTFARGSWFYGTWHDGAISSGRCAYRFMPRRVTAPDGIARIDLHAEGFECRVQRRTTETSSCYDSDGTYRYPDGGVHVGYMVGFKRHGMGVVTYADGSRREGEWVRDRPSSAARS